MSALTADIIPFDNPVTNRPALNVSPELFCSVPDVRSDGRRELQSIVLDSCCPMAVNSIATTSDEASLLQTNCTAKTQRSTLDVDGASQSTILQLP